MAITQQIPIVPITFYDNKKRFSFTFYSGSPGRLRVKVHKFFATDQLKETDKPKLREEVRNVILKELECSGTELQKHKKAISNHYTNI
jgi:1-acyl-sn-glycerol-3-phosphate acyltransferase